MCCAGRVSQFPSNHLCDRQLRDAGSAQGLETPNVSENKIYTLKLSSRPVMDCATSQAGRDGESGGRREGEVILRGNPISHDQTTKSTIILSLAFRGERKRNHIKGPGGGRSKTLSCSGKTSQTQQKKMPQMQIHTHPAHSYTCGLSRSKWNLNSESGVTLWNKCRNLCRGLQRLHFFSFSDPCCQKKKNEGKCERKERRSRRRKRRRRSGGGSGALFLDDSCICGYFCSPSFLILQVDADFFARVGLRCGWEKRLG